MSKKSFIDSVAVTSPCGENWNAMQGTNKVRFCSHCVKDVNNISEMTRREATRLVRASNDKLCVRYIANPVTRRPIFARPLVEISRRAPGVTAGVMTASMALATQGYSQEAATEATPPKIETVRSESFNALGQSKARSGHLSGTIFDPAGAVIPNAMVTIYALGGSVTTTSNSEGLFRFDDLVHANYRIESTAPGFKKSAKEVVVSDLSETVSDMNMEVGFELTVEVILKTDIQMTVSGGSMAVEYALPLNRAIADEDFDAVRDLLSQGADANGKDENYEKITPLFVAVETGNIDIVSLLLAHGAKVNRRDANKQTPLMRIDGETSPEHVNLLIRHGAKLNLTDDEGDTALMHAVDEGARPDVITALIDAGADVRVANKAGQTALMIAAESDKVEFVRMLLVAGSVVNAKNADGETAWDQTTNPEIERLLEASGAETKPRPVDEGEKTIDDPNSPVRF